MCDTLVMFYKQVQVISYISPLSKIAVPNSEIACVFFFIYNATSQITRYSMNQETSSQEKNGRDKHVIHASISSSIRLLHGPSS